MDQQLILKLISYVESASPELWRIAMAQVNVQIYQTYYWMWGFGIMAGILFVSFAFVVIQQMFADKYNRDSNMIIALGLVFFLPSLFLGSLSYYNYIQIISMQLNPEYYAIQVIFDLVK